MAICAGIWKLPAAVFQQTDRTRRCGHSFPPQSWRQVHTHTCTHKRSAVKTHDSKCVSRRLLGGEQVTPCSGGVAPQVTSRSVHHLAGALSGIEHGIERRFLKPPLGETVWTLKDLEQPGKVWQVKRKCPQVRKTPGKSRR